MPQKSRRKVSGNAPGKAPGNTPASTPGTRRSRKKPVVLPVNYSNEPDVLVAGVDEVGRGPLAGSVVAAAVILNPDQPISGLTDSKLLTPAQRQDFDSQIREQALGFAIAEASVEEIDQINILHASMLAMKRAVEALTHDLKMALNLAPSLALIDGNRCPELIIPSKAIVKGDQRYSEISAASIIAKVARDRMMHELHDAHPQYGFDSHKGYPTRRHFSALQEFGVLPEHRRSFGPVRAVLDKSAGSSLPETFAG